MNQMYFNISKVVGIIIITTALSGCFARNPVSQKLEVAKKKIIHTKAYQLKITPIIGSRQDDSKVIMDMGKIMKIWVASYKNNKTFVSSHDNFVVAVAPDFVIGETVPQKNWKSMKTPTNNIPFIFRDADLDSSDELESAEIVKYNNIVYQQQNDVKKAEKRLEKANIYDETIKEFLND